MNQPASPMTEHGLKVQARIGASWEEKLEVIQKMYPDASGADLEIFFHQAKRMGLDPIAKQIHLVTRKAKIKDPKTGQWGFGFKSAIQVGIDGYRSIADRTQLCAGNDDPVFDEGLNQYQMVEAGRKLPKTATCTVYKIIGGMRCPFTATAEWAAYAPKSENGEGGADFMWRKMPFLMLGKCAEALALRKAFPAELGGTHVDAELDHEPTHIKLLDLGAAAPAIAPVAEVAKPAPVQAQPVEAKAAPQQVDEVNENVLMDFTQAVTEEVNLDEVERLYNRFCEAYKKSPATVGAAWDVYQKRLKDFKKN